MDFGKWEEIGGVILKESMKIYKIAPVVKFSPFFDLTYVSKYEYGVGDVVVVDFNRKKIQGVVLEKYNLKDAKVEIRKAQFQTKKIEDSGARNVFSKKQFLALEKFSHEWGIPLGEIVFYLFADEVDTNLNAFSKLFKFENVSDGVEIKIPDFNFEKYTLLTSPHISRLHLFMLYLENFYTPPDPPSKEGRKRRVRGGYKIVVESNFLGVSESLFLEKRKDIKIELLKSDKKVKKYLVNVSYGEIINPEVLEKIENKKTFVFVLSLGYADRIYCNDCKKSYDCENCGHSYSILNEEDGRYLYCKSCKNKKVLKEDQYLICKNCGSWRVFPFGTGVQKVREKFPNLNIGGIKELNKYLKKGEIFDAVVVASLGPLVRGKFFDSDEKLVYLLSKLENISREIYINKNKDDELSLQNFKDKEKFVSEEVILRKELNLPPYRKVLSLIFNYKNKKAVDKLMLTNFEKFKKDGEIKKGNKYIYYWFVDGDTYELARVLRNFGEVIVSNAIVEASFSGGK